MYTGVLALASVVCAVAPAAGGVEVAPPPRVAKPVRAVPAEPVGWYRGDVVGIDARGVTIHGCEHMQPGDEFVMRWFRIGPVLAGGGFDPAEMAPLTYQWSEIRVGDRVQIRVQEDEANDICLAIGILRRPGGRVPPAPGQDPRDENQWHASANAHQDHDLLGLPLPPKYDANYQRLLSQEAQREADMLVALRAAERAAEARRDRVAPPPRPAEPKP